jgi:molybdate transport system permease protein
MLAATHSAWMVSLQLALVSALILALLAIPLGYWLAQHKTALSAFIGTLVLLPLVLPPTVLGFYLLIALGPQGWLGALTQHLGLGLLSFHFSGLVLGSVIFSLPFAVQPIQAAFEAQDPRALELAATLGAKPLDAFWTVAIPQAWPGIVTALILSFTHTLGEFGVVLMIGGNIAGQTRTVSLEIFNAVERMDYPTAHGLSISMIVISFGLLLLLRGLRARR